MAHQLLPKSGVWQTSSHKCKMPPQNNDPHVNTTNQINNRNNKIKIIQINLGRSKLAHETVMMTAKEKDIDILMVQEPNKKIASKDRNWITNKNTDTAIYIVNKIVQIRSIKKTEHYIALELPNVILLCVYLSPNIDRVNYKEKIERIMDYVKANKGKKLILAGDLNAKSSQWGSRVTDKKGQLWEEAMAGEQLVILNEGKKPTFVRRTGSSHIDVTCATKNAQR